MHTKLVPQIQISNNMLLEPETYATLLRYLFVWVTLGFVLKHGSFTQRLTTALKVGIFSLLWPFIVIALAINALYNCCFLFEKP